MLDRAVAWPGMTPLDLKQIRNGTDPPMAPLARDPRFAAIQAKIDRLLMQ